MSETKDTPIKSENKTIKLQEDEYQLEMSLYNNNYIEFKITLNSPMATCYYIEKYNFETIKEISYLFHRKFNDMEAVYQYYKEKIFPKEINLVLSSDKNIMSLMYKKIVDDYNRNGNNVLYVGNPLLPMQILDRINEIQFELINILKDHHLSMFVDNEFDSLKAEIREDMERSYASGK